MNVSQFPQGRLIFHLLALTTPTFLCLSEEPKRTLALTAQESNSLVIEVRPGKPNPTPEASRAKPIQRKTLPIAQPRRWPVQILSAIYGTGGKDADVTQAVREHVEINQRDFAANPRDLGADPNPGWNKSLRITYLKDGVRREQRRNENETLLPESFFGPQDAHELRDWLIATRWAGAKHEIQFNADHTATGPGLPTSLRWEALSANQLRLIWSADRREDHTFDYRWAQFSEKGNAKNVFHAVR